MSSRSRSCVRSGLLAAAIAALLATTALASPPLPEPLRAEAPELRLLGEGQMRWLGIPVYDSTLWVRETYAPDQPFALDIRYRRSIEGQRIARASREEMARLGHGTPAQLARWEQAMLRIFPDVKPGDRIAGLHLPGEGVRFYTAAGLIGEIEDPEFARAFFAIWLDPRTREPELRASLLGAP